MDALELLKFAGVMALAQFSPGPDMLLLTRTALKSGVRAGVRMALGIACGLAVHATLAVGGLALVLDHLPGLRRGMSLAAAAYLLWLAWKILREMFLKPAGSLPLKGGYTTSQQPFLRGLLCNLPNPKVAIVLVALASPFLRGDHPVWWPFAVWGIIVGQGCVLWSLWAGLLQWPILRNFYERSVRWVDGGFAIVLVLLAVKLTLGI
jgi:threonine efflux protein